ICPFLSSSLMPLGSSPSDHDVCPFLYQSSVVHQALHSFPTRRSSDLKLISTVSAAAKLRLPIREVITSSSPLSSQLRPFVTTSRSEEHTSELQSRENLVCRLLLEKKKKSTPTSLRQPKSAKPIQDKTA